MNVTEALKRYAVEQAWVAATATDDDVKKAAGQAVADGRLTPQKLAELSRPAEGGGGAGAAVKKLISDEIKGIDFRTIIADALKGMAGVQAPPPAAPAAGTAGSQTSATSAAGTTQAGTQSGTTVVLTPELVRGEVAAALKEHARQHGEASPHYLLTRHHESGGGVEAHSLRVRKAVDRYDQTRSALHFPKSYPVQELRGAPLTHMSRPLHTASVADKALIGVYTKWLIGVGMKAPGYKMTDHDNDLMEYMLHEAPFVGYVGGDGDSPRDVLLDGRKLDNLERKALLNDAISGGTNAVPLVYDDQAIIAPIQTGELYPLVTTVPLPRGRIVHSFSLGAPVLTTGVPEATPIPLFDTTGFVGGLDTTIYPVVGAIEIGQDFEDDSPWNFGQYVIDRYGERHLEWLDNMVAQGDGVSQPLGIFNTSAMPIVASTNGAGGPLTIADLEALIFGVNRLYRRARGGRMVFVMNDVTYRRFRAIAVATGWNTRLFGSDYNDYTLLGFPVRMIPTVPNNKIAFVNMAYYRMFRRQGLQVKVTTEGKELALRNLRLIVVRALWGGRVTDAASGALMLDAQS